jgi:hypothetical protein
VADMARATFNELNEITYGLQLVYNGVRDFNAEPVFNLYNQLESIEPVGAEIFQKTRLIEDAFGVQAKLLGNELAHVCGHVVLDQICWRKGTASDHGDLPIAPAWGERNLKLASKYDLVEEFFPPLH